MKFETAEDRATERRVFDYMERCWNCNIIQLPEYSAIDGMIYNHDNTLTCLLEFRSYTRSHPMFLFNEDKRNHMLQLSELLKVPALFIARHNDPRTLLYIDVSEEPDEIEVGFERNNPHPDNYPQNVVKYKYERWSKISK